MTYIKLFESWLHSQNQVNELDQAIAPIDLSKIVVSAEAQAEVDADPDYQKLVQQYLQFFKDNGILFSVDSNTAATICAYLSGIHDGGYTWDKRKFTLQATDIKLMDSPEDPSKVLTYGNITATTITNPMDSNGQSDYTEIVKHLNNFALLQMVETGEEGGYWVSVDKNGAAKLVDGNYQDSYALYGTVVTNKAQSNQAVKTTSWTVPAEGKALVKTLPGTMFATGQVTIANSAELDKAIAELNELIADKSNKITSIAIESSASGDRGVNGVSGYPANTPAGKYPMGQPYLPKNAQESGNAKLAFGRAETIKAKLGTLAPTTIKAMIQDGGDAAQYAKLIVNIEKTDKPAQTLSKQELDNILLKKQSTQDLASTKIIKQFKAATRP